MKKVILSSLVILLTGCISENDDMQPRYSSSIQTIEEALNTYINVTKIRELDRKKRLIH